jgi:hypothetical protein
VTAPNTSIRLSHPLVLQPVESPKSWGGETWLNATQKEGPARVANLPGAPTLAETVKNRPEILGKWARLLFGDDVPIFTKFLYTNFPPFVHMGFCNQLNKKDFLSLLEVEQDILRRLYSFLKIGDEAAFKSFQKLYEAWAVDQSLKRWRDPGRDKPFLAALAPFLRPGAPADMPRLLESLRENRARIVEALNEVDLTREIGNLLLSEAGIAHAIFGLSHQTHPLDGAKRALQGLFRTLGELSKQGAPESVLKKTVREAGLPELRRKNAGDPKSEAWIPVLLNGRLALVEPQQTSNVTYSFADFYTPFTWKNGVAFRKGDAAQGVARADLEAFTNSIDFSVTPVDGLRRKPVSVDAGKDAKNAALFRLVDEPETWPFFTAYRLDLQGSAVAEASWNGQPPRGAFQQIVVVEGEIALCHAGFGKTQLTPNVPVFVPATLDGDYTLSARGPASLLLFSVPVPKTGKEA